MTSEIKRSYLLSLYHDIPKKLFNDTNNKIKVQIADRTKMFIQAYGATLTGDGWNSVNTHPFLIMMCVSPASEEFLGAHEGCSLYYRRDQEVLN